jgi:hypothetical protein
MAQDSPGATGLIFPPTTCQSDSSRQSGFTGVRPAPSWRPSFSRSKTTGSKCKAKSVSTNINARLALKGATHLGFVKSYVLYVSLVGSIGEPSFIEAFGIL